MPEGATVIVATTPGDVTLDGRVNADDVAALDRRAASGEQVNYGPTYSELVGPRPISVSNESLPVVTHLEIPGR